MATVFKKSATRALPKDAELFMRKGKQFARWTNRFGKSRNAPVTHGADGQLRISIEAAVYTAKYRDGDGRLVERTTGCRDKTAAEQRLQEFVRRADRVRAGVVTSSEDASIDHQDVPLADHVEAYINHQYTKGLNIQRVKNTKQRLDAVTTDCRWAYLSDIRASSLEQWLNGKQADGMSPGLGTDTGRRGSASATGARSTIGSSRIRCATFRKLMRKPTDDGNAGR